MSFFDDVMKDIKPADTKPADKLATEEKPAGGQPDKVAEGPKKLHTYGSQFDAEFGKKKE